MSSLLITNRFKGALQPEAQTKVSRIIAQVHPHPSSISWKLLQVPQGGFTKAVVMRSSQPPSHLGCFTPLQPRSHQEFCEIHTLGFSWGGKSCSLSSSITLPTNFCSHSRHRVFFFFFLPRTAREFLPSSSWQEMPQLQEKGTQLFTTLASPLPSCAGASLPVGFINLKYKLVAGCTTRWGVVFFFNSSLIVEDLSRNAHPLPQPLGSRAINLCLTSVPSIVSHHPTALFTLLPLQQGLHSQHP